ncbi:MAG: peptidoglycan DD-metalloendopeptidase family protein [Azonexus sp.]|nr:peptidoglycan DD-metalloendopeptidase family protein [Betaproteobacteria bacterium]MBK8918306.1 peptidoglycan DD-metalloendopeptidase family protein [Betaproteobacteria bacterium]MBP6037585.1 peptidoglycan DD-metalloendopeptidase family protein [Azonexus sp.]
MTRLLVLPVALALAGCLTQAPAPSVDRSATAQSRASATPPAAAAVPSGPGWTTVKRGETLYRIALEHGQDYRDVAAWNNITNPASLKEGQVLRVAPPSAPDGGAVVARPVGGGAVVEARPLDKPSTAPVAAAPVDGVVREPKVGKEPYSDEAHARLSAGDAAKGEAKPADPKPTPESRPEAKPDPKPEVLAGPDDVVWAWPTAGKVAAGYGETNAKGLDFSGKAGDAVLAAADGKVLYAGSAIKGYGLLVIIGHKNGFNSVYAHNRKLLVEEKQQVSKGQKIAEMGNTDSETVKLHFEVRKQGKPVDPTQVLPKR